VIGLHSSLIQRRYRFEECLLGAILLPVLSIGSDTSLGRLTFWAVAAKMNCSRVSKTSQPYLAEPDLIA
jgi:hypothetical protein